MRGLVLLGAVLSLCGASFAPEEEPSWIIVPPPPAEPAPAPAAPAGPFDRLIERHARRNALDPALVRAIISVESGFVPRCVSASGALGLMQVMPATGREMGVPPERLQEPEANIRAGTAYLGALSQAARRIYGLGAKPESPWLRARVIAAYHGGPRFLASGDWPPATRDYVRKVLRRLDSAGTEDYLASAASQ